MDNLTFDDHGEAHEGYPSLESSVRDAIVQANPFTSYPGYTTLRDQNTANVRKALAADRVGRMTIAVRVRDSASDLVIDQSWFDHTAAANLKSDNQEAKAFFGYYDIPPQEALAHLTLGIDFEDDSVAIQDANSENNAGNCAPLRSLLDQDWSQIKMLLAAPDTHALPDLSYQAKLQTTAIPSVPGPESSYSAQSASFRFVDGHPDPRDAFDGAAVPCGLGSTLPNAPASQPSTTTH
ncbi:hypothetical protein [Arthrobacter bambusae]|uniref:Uncharacterized protein n=1 Tax=Arthrobacter bambusae TaxID=1338426 RepID=A0AAW8D306_9MICC|nr:hypothetical protein [Arthrobacter bambusae]MDP9903281.1 hypothetical protein [Arthrobacter bambusae]MDQ0128725.1 hypothetical protein [Arthrobacter bambusae]MDQ0180066.1 hypothetical protein [Arthrobacter bambusae]